VTIADGRVVAYKIGGAQPYIIRFSKVSLTTVSFGDRTNYKVKLTRTSDGSVFAFARTPLGIGSAALTKQ